MLAELMRLNSNIAMLGRTEKPQLHIGSNFARWGGLDPTVINGGIIHAYGSNARLGEVTGWLLRQMKVMVHSIDYRNLSCCN